MQLHSNKHERNRIMTIQEKKDTIEALLSKHYSIKQDFLEEFEDLPHNYFIEFVPEKRYTVKAKVKSISKLQPSFVGINISLIQQIKSDQTR